MGTPDFVVALRRHIGHEPLWLMGMTAVVLRGEGDDTELLCVRRADSGRWTMVSGIVDPGENVDETARRECLEEAGVVVEVERLVSMGVTGEAAYPNGDRCNYLDHTLRCRWVSGEPHPADGENVEARFFRLADVPDMPESFRIRLRDGLDNPPDVRLHPAPHGR